MNVKTGWFVSRDDLFMMPMGPNCFVHAVYTYHQKKKVQKNPTSWWVHTHVCPLIDTRIDEFVGGVFAYISFAWIDTIYMHYVSVSRPY